MTIAEERRGLVYTWARNTLTDPAFVAYLAVDDPAVVLIRKLVRKVVRWAAADPTAADSDVAWPVARKWIDTSPATLRGLLDDMKVRGAWNIPLSSSELYDINLDTGRPERPATPITMGAMTDLEIDQRLFGW